MKTVKAATSGTIRGTKDYSMFRIGPYNRDLAKNALLEKSMRKYGFWRHRPLIVTQLSPPAPPALFQIEEGHHRFETARRLNCGVFYQVADDYVHDLAASEGSYRKWSIRDYVTSYARSGRPEYQKALAFLNQHQLPTQVGLGLLQGKHARDDGYLVNAPRNGRLVLGDPAHANRVVHVTDNALRLKVPWATYARFVQAVSAACLIDEFDPKRFADAMRRHPRLMEKSPNVQGYLEQIDYLYNYCAHKGNRLPICRIVAEMMEERNLAKVPK